MSGIYQTLTATLIGWALEDSTPAAIDLKVAGVNPTYEFDSEHSALADLGASVIFTSDPLVGTVSPLGVIDADDVIVTTTPGDNFAGIVLYLEWATGSQLVCFINESSDASFPAAIATTTLTLNFAAEGICRI